MDRYWAANQAGSRQSGADRASDSDSGFKGRTRFQGCSGFTILEALIATVVLVTGLLTVMSFLNSALQVAAEAQTRTVATVLAESKLHTLHSYLQVMDTGLSSTLAECDEPATAGVATFSRCWWVDDSRAVLPIEEPESSCTEGSYGTEAACWVSVRVEVVWTDRQAHPQHVMLTSMINVLTPERGALDLMTWVTHAQLPGPSLQWVAAGEFVEEGGTEGLGEPDDDTVADGVPDLPVDNSPQPITCPPWWELEGELPPNLEVEDEC